jgi:hypothetical protein
MKNKFTIEFKNLIKGHSLRASIVLSIIAGGVSFALAANWAFWGITYQGYRELPLFYKVVGSIILWPALLILPDDYMAGDWSLLRFFIVLIINAIPWSILVFIIHRVYCIFIKQ